MSDALERLKQRQRPTVPSRNASLESESLDISISETLDISVPESIDKGISKSQSKSLATKQTTIRLESKLLERVTKVCAKENLSREVLFEALFEHYEQDSEAWESIISQAKEKADHRLAIANRKRAKTMMQRFSS
jgi:predicted transcriptional regulator